MTLPDVGYFNFNALESNLGVSGHEKGINMNDIILSIEEHSCNAKDVPEIKSDYGSFEGFRIVTNQQEILLLIDNQQNCCEDWGYFMSEDEFSGFIKAELLDISITDEALNEAKMKEHDIDDKSKLYEGGMMFVDIKTSYGVLQFVAYNEHNGYYSHDAVVISRQLNHRESL